MDPIQRAALSHERMLCGLLTVTLPVLSSMVPPPSDTCPSKALEVRLSEGAPCRRSPRNLCSGCALARLNPPRHDFELFPCLRRCSIPVFSHQIHPVKQHPFVQLSRQNQEPAVHRIGRNELRKVRLDRQENSSVVGHSHLWHHGAMSSTVKTITVAVVSFVLGHLSCALMHHMHHAQHLVR
jgi:hypothetical protein